jgi:hypothetical protein
MARAKWKESLAATLAWAGLAWGQAGPAPTPPLGIGRDLLTVREPGRPEQKCRILKAWKQSDGTLAFEVQCLETEEHMTLVEMAASGPLADTSKGMRSRIYHWGQSSTPPAGVPQIPTGPVNTPEIEANVKSEKASMAGSPFSPTSSAVASTTDSTTTLETKKPESSYPLPPETKLGPIQVETAKPSNWHESWGKADDHHTNLTEEKIIPPSPANHEPEDVPVIPPTTPELPPSTSSIQPKTSVEQVSSETSPVNSAPRERVEESVKSMQPAGYSHVDDRPGIAHVTDMPPAGAKVASESKAPVMDFLRTLWKPPLKEPAPLQTIQVAEAPAPTPAPSAQQYISVLHESLLPSEREMAVEALSGLERQQDPTVVPALLRTAVDDPAATVRASCVHGLVKMNANTKDVVGVFMNLKADPDLRVRREVHQALITFGLAKPEPENEMIHQISAPGGKIGEW